MSGAICGYAEASQRFVHSDKMWVTFDEETNAGPSAPLKNAALRMTASFWALGKRHLLNEP